MGNFNYLGKDWSNIVFEGRNKMYGAYKLREENIKNTTLALILGIGGLGLLFGGTSYLYASNLNYSTKNHDDGIICKYPIIEVNLIDVDNSNKQKPIEKPFTDETPKVEPEKIVSSARTDVQENIKFTETKIIDENKQIESLASQDMFNDATNSGVSNSDADLEKGKLKSDGRVTGLSTEGNEGTNRKTTEETTKILEEKAHTFVQHKAEPIEGFEKFYNNFARKFSNQDINTNSSEIEVRVKFVVEKDGSFTNIQILDDKYGVGKEAERILKSMPKWKAASHNGKTVRSMFILPIKIQVK
nr:hypothetical protein [uncultured Flavobacterium sp.]